LDSLNRTRSEPEQQVLPGRFISFPEQVGPLFWLSTGWILLVAIFALTADFLPLVKYDHMDFACQASPPGTVSQISTNSGNGINGEKPYIYILGTDTMGRDIVSRLIFGARVSMAVGFAAPVIGLVLGAILGMTAGYYRGKIETIIIIIMDTILAFPGIVLLLAITFYLGPSLKNIILALGILTVPSFCRVSRANTIKYANRDFILAARMAGRSDPGIIFYEILPDVIIPLAVYGLIVVSYMIVAEGTLSYLGLGVPSPVPSWGAMIAEGREVLGEATHISLIPAMVMSITVLSFNLVGDSFRSVVDIRQGQL
jgi:peptide/nickel transport system permease protein